MMKEAGLNLIERFHLRELNLDFMGYSLMPNDIYTFHHLIVPSCKNGPYVEWNGAILCGSTSHPYLHIIGEIDYDMFLAITKEMIIQNIKGYLDKKNLLRIRAILKEFEKEYLHDKERCKFDIKDKYLQRPSLDEPLIRKRVI